MNTLYKNIPGVRCCHNCEPERFVAEEVVLQKKPGLKRGSKSMASESFQRFMRERLVLWRESLLQQLYSDTILITPGVIMSNETIQKISAERNRIHTEADLKSRVRWMFGGVRPGPGEIGEHGKALLAKLNDIYAEYDANQSRVDEDEDFDGRDSEEEEEKEKPTNHKRRRVDKEKKHKECEVVEGRDLEVEGSS